MKAPVGLCEADLAERVVEDPRLAVVSGPSGSIQDRILGLLAGVKGWVLLPPGRPAADPLRPAAELAADSKTILYPMNQFLEP